MRTLLALVVIFWFSPGVPVYKGITIVLSFFRSHWLTVVYCLVFCIGSCEPVHEEGTNFFVHTVHCCVRPDSVAVVVFYLSKRSFSDDGINLLKISPFGVIPSDIKTVYILY